MRLATGLIDMIHRLSHSALDLFHTCERKFQLDRLLLGATEKQDYPDTIFGKAFGIGVATYLTTQDRDLALFKTWLAYEPELENDKKSLCTCLNAIACSFVPLDTLLLDWEPATYSPETSFRLNIDTDFYYVGYIDAIMRNRWNGRYAVIEVKTTGMQLMDLDPLYQNSGQAVGYSIVLDRIAGEEQSSYDVIYIVAQLDKSGFVPNILIRTYPKTLQDRLNWFLTLGLDVNNLQQMLSLNFFPQRGASCLRYNKPCKHFGVCGLHGLDRPKEIIPDLIEYDYVYDMNELIANHMDRATQ